MKLVGVALTCLVLLVGGGVVSAEERGWYLGIGAGLGWSASLDEAGSNFDTTCSPNRDCSGRRIGGYRWYHDLALDEGRAIELAVGRSFGDVRVELAASQQTHPVELAFIGISYLDGSDLAPWMEDSPYVSDGSRSVEDFITRTIAINLYWDFPLQRSRMVPYVGAGLGLSFVKLKGLRFHSDYSCIEGRICSPSADRYDSLASGNVEDVVPAGQVHAGVDYWLSRRLAIGLKGSWRMIGDIDDTLTYRQHEMPGLRYVEKVSGIRQGAVLVSLRYGF